MTGILLIDKPEGMTSFVAAARVRRMTGVKKTGHTGTLDPMATGVLPVLLGGATRFCELLPSHDKAYIASLRLGTVTDTLDITGEVLETREVNALHADFESALQSFSGTIEQVPPMYSAISQNGVRLYKLARQGIEVERESRTVNISSISLVGCNEKKRRIYNIRRVLGGHLYPLARRRYRRKARLRSRYDCAAPHKGKRVPDRRMHNPR